MTRAVTVAESFNSTVAVGTIIPASSSTVPTGYLACNGGEYAIANYGDLHSVIGTTWGSLTDGSGGSGSTHFVVPDLRGSFLRGSGTGTINSRNKAGGSVGTFTEDQFETHKHGSGNHSYGQDFWVSPRNFTSGSGSLYINTSDPKSPARHGSETFPYHATVQYCIKY